MKHVFVSYQNKNKTFPTVNLTLTISSVTITVPTLLLCSEDRNQKTVKVLVRSKL